MQQPYKPPRVRRKSRKRRGDDEQQRPSGGGDKRIPLTLQISGAIAAGMFLIVAVIVLMAAIGISNGFFLFVGVIAGFGGIGAAIMFGVTGWELLRSRCPKCRKYGTFSPTGTKELLTGEGGMYVDYKCAECGYKKTRFEKSMEGGDRALGRDYDPFTMG